MNFRVYATDKQPVFTNEEGREIDSSTREPTGFFLCDYVEHPSGIVFLGIKQPEHCVPSPRFYQPGEFAVLTSDSYSRYAAEQKDRETVLCMDIGPVTKIQIRQAKLASAEELAQLKAKYDSGFAAYRAEQLAVIDSHESRIEELRAQARQIFLDKQKALAALQPPSLEQFF